MSEIPRHEYTCHGRQRKRCNKYCDDSVGPLKPHYPSLKSAMAQHYCREPRIFTFALCDSPDQFNGAWNFARWCDWFGNWVSFSHNSSWKADCVAMHPSRTGRGAQTTLSHRAINGTVSNDSLKDRESGGGHVNTDSFLYSLPQLTIRILGAKQETNWLDESGPMSKVQAGATQRVRRVRSKRKQVQPGRPGLWGKYCRS